MAMKDKTHLSKDHWIEQEGAAWAHSDDPEDFEPYIPKEEFEGRTRKAKELLARHGMDAMVLFAYSNKQYYGGYREANMRHTDRWRHCFIVSQDHDTVFVGESVLHNGVTKTTWVKDLRLWSSVTLWRLPTRFLDVFTATMSDLRLDNKVIGLEMGPGHIQQASYRELCEIQAALPNARFVAADDLIWEQKAIKTDWEIALFREMCDKTRRVLDKGYRAIRPGVTEWDVHRVFYEELVKEGMHHSPTVNDPLLFLCGTDAPGRWRLVSPPFTNRVIREGDQGFSDGGPMYKGYCTDIQRGFYVGERLPPRLEELSRWGRDAYMNTVNNIVPGMRGCDIFKLGEKETYRQDWNQLVPIDFVGHSIGSTIHEPPFLGPHDLTPIEPGMILCVELGCYGTDLVIFGNMPEDMWLVTDKGLELIGVDLPRDIRLCG
jgi:Xaa-Pro aminopeptidase